MKKKIYKLICLIFGLAISIIIVRFGHFDYASGNYNTTFSGSNDLVRNGGYSKFQFTAENQYIRGFIVHSTKNFYIPNEDRIKIELTVKCLENQDRQSQSVFPLSRINISGNQTLLISPVDCGKGLVGVEFHMLDPVSSSYNILIDNQDTNADPNINSAPRIIYRQYFRKIIRETWSNMLTKDKKFTICYTALLAVILCICAVGLINKRE